MRGTPSWFRGWILKDGKDVILTDFGKYDVSREPIEVHGWSVKLIDKRPLYIWNHKTQQRELYEGIGSDRETSDVELEFNKL